MQYNKDDLEKMALVDLRIIGRAVGVKSPTSLKKSELVTEILLVVNGEKPSLKSEGGRPVVARVVLPDEPLQKLIEKKQEPINLKRFEKRLDRILSDLKKLMLEIAKEKADF